MSSMPECVKCGDYIYHGPVLCQKCATDTIESLVFWMEELLKLARELSKDLKHFYEPDKGYPPHIEVLEGISDYDTVLAQNKAFLKTLQAFSRKGV